jgi:hypothetical protein
VHLAVQLEKGCAFWKLDCRKSDEKLDCAQFVSSFRVKVVGVLNYFDDFPDDVWDSRSDLS